MISNPIINTIQFNSPLLGIEINELDDKIVSLNFVEPKNFNNEKNKETKLLGEAKKQLLAYFNGNLSSFDLPLDINGSVFENKVWHKLSEIPFGKTISYGEIAILLGDIKFSRAIGAANGRNPIPIIIPCHRVIGKKGNLTGFSGGIWRKRWLLQHEDKIKNGIITLFDLP